MQKRSAQQSPPIWSASYAFQYLRKALVDFLVQDVIELIGTYSKQEKMLLLQGRPIKSRSPSPPNFMTIYGPSNNTWTDDDKDWRDLRHGWNTGIFGVWQNIFMTCENIQHDNKTPRLDIMECNLRTGQLCNFTLNPRTIYAVTHLSNLCGMLHVKNIVMDGYYLSYNMIEEGWVRAVKEFIIPKDEIKDTTSRLISSSDNSRLFMATSYEDNNELFEYDVMKLAWMKRAPPIMGIDDTDNYLTILYKNYIYYFEVDSKADSNDDIGQTYGQQYDMAKDAWTWMPPFESENIDNRCELAGSVVDHHIILSIRHFDVGKRIIVKYHLETNREWEVIAPMQQLFGVSDILAVTI